jgi:hypothetical protein
MIETKADRLQRGSSRYSNDAKSDYQAKKSKVLNLLDQVRSLVNSHAQLQKNDPGNYGYVGDLASIESDLSDILRSFRY